MEKFKVEFLQPALDDLEEIVLYIAKDSMTAAFKMHDEIITQSKNLETFPKLGREVPNRKIRESEFRMLIISPYIAFYRVIGKVIFIYRVLHGARNYPRLFNDFLNFKG